MLLVNSLQSGKAWQEYAQKTEKSYSHTNSAVSRQVHIHVLLVQHPYGVFFQYMVWCGPTSVTAWMQRKQKNWLKCTDFTELKKITSRINSNTSNFSSLFFKSIKLVAVRFVWLKNNLQLNVPVCCLFYFLLHTKFFKGKVKSGNFGGFYCFSLRGLVKKRGNFLCLGPITWR